MFVNPARVVAISEVRQVDDVHIYYVYTDQPADSKSHMVYCEHPTRTIANTERLALVRAIQDFLFRDSI